MAYLTRFGEGMLPTPETRLQQGDILHAMMPVAATGRNRPHPLRSPATRTGMIAAPEEYGSAMKVIIAGAGSVGSSIAKELLAHGHEVLLIDEKPEVDRRAAGCRGRAGCSATPAS